MAVGFGSCRAGGMLAQVVVVVVAVALYACCVDTAVMAVVLLLSVVAAAAAVVVRLLPVVHQRVQCRATPKPPPHRLHVVFVRLQRRCASSGEPSPLHCGPLPLLTSMS